MFDKVKETKMNHEQAFGSIIIISGPSGVGKSTIINLFTDEKVLPHDREVRFSVSCTTRAKRTGEIEDQNYHFISEEMFDKFISEDAFLEYAEVHGHRYGTLKSELNCIKSGNDIILDIDVQGMRKIRNKLSDNKFFSSRLVTIFVMPPSMGELEKRLRGRRTDAESDIVRRLSNARKEMDAWREYDHILINENSHECAESLWAIIRASHTRSSIIETETWKNV